MKPFKKTNTHLLQRVASALGILIVSSAVLAACGGGQTSSKGGGVVQIGVFPISTYLPDQVAAREGFFEKNDLKVKLVGPAMTGNTAYQLMTTNKLQSYFNDIVSTTTAISNGTNVTVGGCVAPRSIYVVVANKSAGLPADGSFNAKVRALKGKNIGVTALGSGTDVSVSVALKAAGLAAEDVTKIAVGPPNSAISQLKKGRIDAYVTGSDSGAMQITESAPGTGVYLNMGDDSSPMPARTFATGGWAVSAKWAKEQPEQLDAYRKSLLQAIAWIKDHPDDAAQIMADTMFDGADLALAQESVKAYIDNYADTDLTCDRKTVATAFGVFKDLKLGPTNELKYNTLVAPAARASS